MQLDGIPTFPTDPTPGRYFVVRVAPQGGPERIDLFAEPARTNMSRERRVRGWLGTTNNVAKFAEGACEVRRDSLGRLYAVECDPEALLSEWDEAQELRRN